MASPTGTMFYSHSRGCCHGHVLHPARPRRHPHFCCPNRWRAHEAARDSCPFPAIRPPQACPCIPPCQQNPDKIFRAFPWPQENHPLILALLCINRTYGCLKHEGRLGYPNRPSCFGFLVVVTFPFCFPNSSAIQCLRKDRKWQIPTAGCRSHKKSVRTRAFLPCWWNFGERLQKSCTPPQCLA